MALATTIVWANNIQVSNVSLKDQDSGQGFTKVQFDLGWENSWRHPFSTGINNWDAAWVFVKYRVPESEGGDGGWKHARLHNTGHSPGAGMTADAGLLHPGEAWNATTNPALGVFIYRSEPGRGDINLAGVQLRWNYGDNGLANTDLVEVQVFAIEMVYVAEGAFFVGSGGTETGSFTRANNTSGATVPFEITSTPPTIQGNSTSSSSSNLGARGSMDLTGTNTASLASGFPTGYSAFYMMKYSITQQQYVDFLNLLTRDQQAVRVSATIATRFTGTTNDQTAPQNRNGVRVMTDPGGSTPRVYGCDLNINNTAGEAADGQWIAMNFMSWGDGAAYMDWSGLRPMTELEYEKAARGPANPVANEYAWGTATIAANPYTLNNAGAANEGIETNYSTSLGNANNFTTRPSNASHQGPMRVGIFAAHGSNSGRVSSGASYWGIMELSGNLSERPVTVGNVAGRSFTGLHGNGELNSAGAADVNHWPGINDNSDIGTANAVYGGTTGVTQAAGSGFRGGSWNANASASRVSGRGGAASAATNRSLSYGFRGVRSAGCVNNATAPDFDTSNGLSPNTASAGQLLTYKVTGTGSYLWVVPNNWQIVSGQGTNEITVIAGTVPATIRVAAYDTCGAGAQATLTVNVAP